ncbi:MAG: signal peptidase I [Clostridia bacterium]|nr:signal peptidase I [Clostridia bacterium]
MSKSMAKPLKIISMALMVLMILLAVLMAGVRIFGVQIYMVLSGSMEPKYPTGSLLYITAADPDKLEEGDVITFRLHGSVTATHRIVEVVTDEATGEEKFRTKGDANESTDESLVAKEDVVGRAVFCIPLLGYLAAFIQQPPGLYVAIAAAVLMIVLVFLSDTLQEEKAKGEKSNEK